MSRQFDNRVDYVDLRAFGDEEKSMVYQGYNQQEFDQIIDDNQGYGKLKSQLKKLEDSLDNTRLMLTTMSLKYDY
jgi:hypothetical protein